MRKLFKYKTIIRNLIKVMAYHQKLMVHLIGLNRSFSCIPTRYQRYWESFYV